MKRLEQTIKKWNSKTMDALGLLFTHGIRFVLKVCWLGRADLQGGFGDGPRRVGYRIQLTASRTCCRVLDNIVLRLPCIGTHPIQGDFLHLLT
jgi:hypothetical protein